MRYGIILTTGDVRQLAEMAAEAEAAGWDAVFYWDAVAIPNAEIYDPWIVMTAIALRTERVTFGAIVTPPSRRRPWKLAREAATLDRLSGGRLVLPVGLGALDDLAFANVGEPTDARTRAELLDESLAILDGLWGGEPFGFEGKHYRFGPMQFRPTPIQRPRVPIWVIGLWPRERSMQRAVRWDGVMPAYMDEHGSHAPVTPEVVRAIRQYGDRERRAAGADAERQWEIAVDGTTPADDPAAAAATTLPYAEAGATWWIEADWEAPSIGGLRKRIAAGPPRAVSSAG